MRLPNIFSSPRRAAEPAALNGSKAAAGTNDDQDMDLDTGFAIEAALAQSSDGEADLSKDTITSLQNHDHDDEDEEDVVPDSDPEHTPEYLEPADEAAEETKPISRVSSLSSLSSINFEEALSEPDISDTDWQTACFSAGYGGKRIPGLALPGTSSTPPMNGSHPQRHGRKISDAGSMHSTSTVGSGRAGKQRSNVPDITVATSPRKRFNKPVATSSIVAAARDKDRKTRTSTSSTSQSRSRRRSMRNDASTSRRSRRLQSEDAEDMDLDEDDTGNASASSSSSSAIVVAVSQSSSKNRLKPKSESETDYSQEPGPVPVKQKKSKQKKKEEEYVESQELPEQPPTRKSRRSVTEMEKAGKTTRKSSLRNGGTVSPAVSEDEAPRSKKLIKEEKKAEPFVAMSTSLGGTKLTASEILEQMRQKQMKDMGIETASKPSTSKAPATGIEYDEDLDGPMLIGKKSGSDSDEDEDEELEDASVLFAKGKERAKPKPLPVVKLPTDSSKYALDKLYKKKQREEQRGWYGVESAEASFAKHTSDGDLDDLLESTSKRIDSDDDDEEDDEELPEFEKSTSASKEKRQRRPSDGAMKRVAGALSGNQDALDAVKIANDALDKAEPEMAAETAAEKRSLWNAKHKRRIQPFKPYETDGKEGYDLALRQGIINGLKDPAAFPVELFSFFTVSPDALASSLPITYSLFQLIAHPNTSTPLANKALVVLERILRKLPSFIASGRQEDTDIDMGDVVKAFLDLAAKRDFFAEDLLEAADISEDVPETQDMTSELLPGDILEDAEDGKEAFGEDMRTAAAYRILSMLKILIQTRQNDSDLLESFALFLVRIPQEGDNDQLQTQATRVLEALVNVLDDGRIIKLRQTLLDHLQSLQTRQEQFAILKRLPMYTPQQTSLIKTLILACLFGPGFVDEDVLRDPTIGEILTALRSSSATTPHPRVTTETYTDKEIYHTALILQLLLHDTAHFLLVDSHVKDDALTAKGEAARETIKDIVSYLRKAESKMRSHVRSGDPIRDKAKNALTRLQHSLDYQYIAASHASKKTAMRDKFNGVEHKVDSTGQMSLKGFTRAQPRHITPKPAMEADLVVV